MIFDLNLKKNKKTVFSTNKAISYQSHKLDGIMMLGIKRREMERKQKKKRQRGSK